MKKDNVIKLVNTGREKIELSEGRLATWDTSGEKEFYQMQIQAKQNQSQQANSNTSNNKKE